MNNTSGFFPNQDNGVVAIFTLAEYPGGYAGPQQQAIAYSHDGGYSFIMYEGNPVIPSNSSEFRDPKVIRYKDHWVMVVAYSQEFTIGFFTSPNLKNWMHASNLSYIGLLGLQYECPDLVEMPVLGTDTTMYVLQIGINPGAPLGGSISQNFPGHFNGTHFTPVDGATRINDFGKDNYAGQFFYGIPSGQDAISIGWSSNWQYAETVPTGPLESWRSSMSLPRRNYLTNNPLIGWNMVSYPYDLSSVLGPKIASNSSLNNGTLFVDYSAEYSNALYFEANVTGINITTVVSGSATFNFTFYSPISQEYLSGGFFFGGFNNFFIDRGGIRGFDDVLFTDKFTTEHLINENGTWSVTGVIDRSIFEVFIEGGQRSATTTFFPTQPLTKLIITTADLLPSMSVSVAVYSIESAWLQYENEQGMVFGNTTSVNSTAGKRHMVYDAGYGAVDY